MEQIAELARSKKLDEHQKGLTRILRYRENWRLRETVLKCIKDLEVPSDEILAEVLDAMMDETLYCEARLLAADALCDWVQKHRDDGDDDRCVAPSRVVGKMTMILDSPQPPFMQEAIRGFLEAIRKTRPVR